MSGSVQGLLTFISDPSSEVSTYALRTLVDIAHAHWPEIIEHLPEIENLSEDPSYPGRKVAALLAAKAYFYLGANEETVLFALEADDLFDIAARTVDGSRDEFASKVAWQVVDIYTDAMIARDDAACAAREAAEAEGGDTAAVTNAANVAPEVPLDPRVERQFGRLAKAWLGAVPSMPAKQRYAAVLNVCGVLVRARRNDLLAEALEVAQRCLPPLGVTAVLRMMPNLIHLSVSGAAAAPMLEVVLKASRAVAGSGGSAPRTAVPLDTPDANDASQFPLVASIGAGAGLDGVLVVRCLAAARRAVEVGRVVVELATAACGPAATCDDSAVAVVGVDSEGDAKHSAARGVGALKAQLYDPVVEADCLQTALEVSMLAPAIARRALAEVAAAMVEAKGAGGSAGGADGAATKSGSEWRVSSAKRDLLRRCAVVISGHAAAVQRAQFLAASFKGDVPTLGRMRTAVGGALERGSPLGPPMLSAAVVSAHGLIFCGTTNDNWIREPKRLDWFQSSINFAKLSAVASFGSLHSGHADDPFALLKESLPGASARPGASTFAQAGAMYAMGLICAPILSDPPKDATTIAGLEEKKTSRRGRRGGRTMGETAASAGAPAEGTTEGGSGAAEGEAAGGGSDSDASVQVGDAPMGETSGAAGGDAGAVTNASTVGPEGPLSNKAVVTFLLDQLQTATTTNGGEKEHVVAGAALGLGLATLGAGGASPDPLSSETVGALQLAYMADLAIGSEAAAIGLGLHFAGSPVPDLVEDFMVKGAETTEHDRMARGSGVGLGLMHIGVGHRADPLVSRLRSSRDALLRHAAAYVLGLAYVGSGNVRAVSQLLDMAVSDTALIVKRTAVSMVGFVYARQPQACVDALRILSDSYSADVCYGVAIALGIACAGIPTRSASDLLATLKEHRAEWVVQGVLIASAMMYNQASPSNSEYTELRESLITRVEEKHGDLLARWGAIIASGILDAGGCNLTPQLVSQNGVVNVRAVAGMAIFLQHWWWQPYVHFLSLTLRPTYFLALDRTLAPPVVSATLTSKVVQPYPAPLVDPKSKKKTGPAAPTAAVVLSTTKKVSDRKKEKERKEAEEKEAEGGGGAAVAEGGSQAAAAGDVDMGKGDGEKKEDEKDPAKEVGRRTVPNRTRVVASQQQFVTLPAGGRYTLSRLVAPVGLSGHPDGAVFVVDSTPQETREVLGHEALAATAVSEPAEPSTPAAFDYP